MNELEKVHKMVWRFRAVMSPHWATPEPIDCLRYAFCEAGEAMDAWLRQQRPGDSRNNERNPDVLDELADCAIMLLSAIDHEFPVMIGPKGKETLLEQICANCGRLLVDDNSYPASFVLADIFYYEGMEDLEERVSHRLFKIATKHAPDEETRLRAIDTLYE